MPPRTDSTIGPAVTVRAKIGRVAQKFVPNLDEWQWNRKRDREVQAWLSAGDYIERLRDVENLGTPGRKSHLVVVPMIGESDPNWKAAGGNYFFEVAQTAREYAGADKVTVFSREPGESSVDWHCRLIRYLLESGATHLAAQSEKDPDEFDRWTWDILWSQLAPRWDGIFLGVTFDSAYRWITIMQRRLARISERFVLVDICMPMNYSMVKGRPEVGPVGMPLSTLSLSVIDEATADLEQIYDVSFIGVLYPVRVDLIRELRERGVDVAVNPHRKDAAGDLAASQANQPSFVDYMAALKQSRMTINFSISSALNSQQLKNRVLEATAMGCLLLTDDVDRTDRYWKEGEEYASFSTLEDLPTVIEEYLSDPDRLQRVQQAGKRRARQINSSSFWGGVDDVLTQRGLPQLKS